MKKVLALVLVAVMAIGFVSCGKNASGDVPTLIWYMPGEKQADTGLINEEINKIIEPKIGAKIDIQYISTGDYTERMRLIMASQEEFDLCFTGWTNPYLDGVRAGGYLELSDLLEEYGKELDGVIPEYLYEAAEYDGGIYAIPCYQAMTQCLAIYLRKDMVDKYNFDISKVTKLEDVVPYLDAVRDGEKGKLFPSGGLSTESFVDDIYRYQETSIPYIKLDRDTKKVVFQYDIPGRAEARRTMQDWRKAGYFNPDITASTPQSQIGIYVNGGYRPGSVADTSVSFGTEVVAVPITGYTLGRSGATTTMTAISATSKNPEKAMQFLVEVSTNPDVFNLAAYGIEGKHYTKIGENKIKRIADSGYAPAENWKFGNMFMGYLLENYEDDLWDQIQTVNNEATKDYLLGFVADTTPVTTIISQIATVISEYKEVENGTSLDLDAKEKEFNQKLEAAGKNELIEYAEKVIYEYLDEKGLR